jgi:predicted RecA/RadA family phage recombinase
MAKNHAGEGRSRTFVSPTGGTKSGVPVAINALVVIPLEDTVKGQPFTGVLGDVWTLQVTGALKAGVKVSVLAGVLVADGTADAVPFGKLLTDAVGGYAEALLIQ